MQIMTFEGPTWCRFDRNIFLQIEYWAAEKKNRNAREIDKYPTFFKSDFFLASQNSRDVPKGKISKSIELIFPNVFQLQQIWDCALVWGGYISDQFQLPSLAITPWKKAKCDNFWRGEGGRGCQNNVWCGKLFKLTNRKLLRKSCAQNQSTETCI